MNKLNVFFFGEEAISFHDAVWFYGGYALFTAIILVTVLVVQ